MLDNKGLKPIKKKSVVDQILDRIVNAISSGVYKAGQRLPSEYELMEELQVSRNSLREAMKVLETMGILEIKRGDGTYICSHMEPSLLDSMVYGMIFDISSNAETIELRQVIDAAMIEIAIKKATDADLQVLEKNIEQMKEAIESREYEKAAKLDLEFHLGILESARNPLLQRIAGGVYNLFFKYIETTILEERRFNNSVEHHKKMLECMKAKDIQNIGAVVRNSLETWNTKKDEKN